MRDMLALLQEAASQVPEGLQIWVARATIVQGFGTPLLIAIGGFFAWYKFIRQGEHDPRLQATVEANEVSVQDGVAYIIAKVSVENTGQVDVTINLDPSALFLVGKEAGHEWSDPDSDHTYDVFVGQNLVQVNATIEDKVWIERSVTKEVALSLQLAVAGKAGKESRDWRTSHIISLLGGGHSSQDG